MFEQTFKNIDDILHKDAGCTSELDYTEQSSWLLFLKYLDALEHDKASEAELEAKHYSYILDEAYRWEAWAAPKTQDGTLDHNTTLTGDDLRDFVNGKLFPYLGGFKQRASGPNTIEYKIGEVFGEIKNKVQSGYNLRDVIDLVDELRFRSLHAASTDPRHDQGCRAQDRRAHLRRRVRLGWLFVRSLRLPESAGDQGR
jgi:type I restriction enzyme M protein